MSCKVPESEMGESKAHLNLFRVCEETACCSPLSVMVEEVLHRLSMHLGMPRPCAVVVHAHCYLLAWKSFCDAKALRRGSSRSLLPTRLEIFLRCHGLAPWSFTLTAVSAP